MRITVMHDIAANQNPASPAESGKSRKSNWFGELTAIPSQIADHKAAYRPYSGETSKCGSIEDAAISESQFILCPKRHDTQLELIILQLRTISVFSCPSSTDYLQVSIE